MLHSTLLFLKVLTALALTQQGPGPDPGRSGRPRTIDTKGGGRGGRQARAKSDFADERQKILDAASADPAAPDFKPLDAATFAKDLGALITAANDESTRRKLPNFTENPENTYAPEVTAFRKEVYEPLRENAVTRELLRGLVRKAQTGYDFTSTTAALVLADAPDEADLDALFEGYDATTPENRTPHARQLGRALGAVKDLSPRPPRADEMLARIKADALEGKAVSRGAALEALWRAGEGELALQHLKKLLSDKTDPLEAVTVLQACSRLLTRSDVDPFLRARAVAVAHAAVEEVLADTSDVTPTQAIGGKGRMVRSATSFLQDVGGAHEVDLVLRCLVEPRAQRLLGMDGLQSIRYGFSRARATMSPEQGAKIDEWFLRVIVDAATRLFSLEEEAMTQEEQRAFWDARDLRFNALSYFIDQLRRTKAVKERLEKEHDFQELLVTLYRASADVKEERDGDVVYRGVADKLENRVTALELLANLEREFNRPAPGIDLFGEALAVICTEVHAGLVSPAEVANFRKAYAPHVMLEFPVGKEPADEFVKRTGAMTIATLGYVVHTGEGKIGIEVDAENPWPWERDGKPPLVPEKKDAPAAEPAKDESGAKDPKAAKDPKSGG